MSRRCCQPARARRAAALAPALAVALVVTPASASRFVDVRNGSDQNHITYEESWTIEFPASPGRVEFYLRRPESLDYGSELAYYRQYPQTWYECLPPADIVDRSEWYTRLVWLPGSLAGRTRLTVDALTEADRYVETPGISHDLTRSPGDYYTSFTPTIQYVPGIVEAIGFIASTMDQVHGLPPGDIGLAQRWMAWLLGTIPAGAGTHGVDDAASVWQRGVADCDGYSNMFASGMRSLGIPTCVTLSYVLPGGPMTGEFVWLGTGRGYHAWAGVWSDGLGAFVPVDAALYEAGFAQAQQLELAYVEDLQNAKSLVVSSSGPLTASLTAAQAVQSNPGGIWPQVRVRHLDDGFNDVLILAHETVLSRAPGGTVGVPDSSARHGEKLLAGTPFREALNASLLLEEPGRVTLDLFDVTGRRVARLADGRPAPRGESFFRWPAGAAAEGLYFLRARTDDGRVFQQRVVLRR